MNYFTELESLHRLNRRYSRYWLAIYNEYYLNNGVFKAV